jgi:amino acid transporter
LSDEYKIPVGPLIAVGGAVLLVVSLFLDWYESLTGWTVFEIVDLVLVGLAVWTILSLAGAFGIVKATSNPVAALIGAVVTLVIVVTQVINDPPAVAGGGGPAKDIGIWLALGGAGLMVVGAVLATTHISLAVEARRREAAEPGSAEPKDAERDEPTVPLGRTQPPERPPGGPERP